VGGGGEAGHDTLRAHLGADVVDAAETKENSE
jgi:hypothetical protein